MYDRELPPALNIYQDNARLLYDLEDDETGRVFKASVIYFFSGELPEELSPAESLVFNRVRDGLDYAFDTWKERRQNARDAALSRWNRAKEEENDE